MFSAGNHHQASFVYGQEIYENIVAASYHWQVAFGFNNIHVLRPENIVASSYH